MRVTTYKFVTTLVAVALALLIAEPVLGGEYCKWTDENGVVHYAEKCPDQAKSSVVATQSKRTDSQIEAAEAHAESLLKKPSQLIKPTGQTQRYRSLPKKKLGPLPPNSTSEFLRTTGADYKLNSGTLQGNFILFLEARTNMPEDAWVEAAFPNPSDITKLDMVGKSVGPNQKFMLESPATRDLKCWNYVVQVSVFGDSGKNELIDIHQQVVQSRVNMALVKNSDDLVLGVTTGLCDRNDQQDFSRMSVAELEALCRKEREKRLSPQRERLIRNCVQRQDKSREYCENYFADYGDAQRINPGQVRPALYMDLPACVAAGKTKKAER